MPLIYILISQVLLLRLKIFLLTIVYKLNINISSIITNFLPQIYNLLSCLMSAISQK